MQHPRWWENTSTIISQWRIKVCLEKYVNTSKNEKYSAFFYLMDCSQVIPIVLWRWLLCYLLLCRNATSKMWRHHKNIYVSSWPWLPTVTMPDHTVITTFTLVKFLLSFAAFTKVSVSVYTRKMFTLVSKLWYLNKPFKSKHSIRHQDVLHLCESQTPRKGFKTSACHRFSDKLGYDI